MHPAARLRRIIAECEQLIVDVESWNENRPDAPPMDCEGDRVLLSQARGCLAAFYAGDEAEFQRHYARMQQTCETYVDPHETAS